MKAFRFRIEAVLTLREQTEQAAQLRCAQAYIAVEAAAGRLRAAEMAIEEAEKTHRAELAVGPRASQMEHLRVYILLLRERRLQLEGKLAEARQRAESAWRDLLGATQQREALERVRSRQKRVHDYESARAEQRTLDERSSRSPTGNEACREPSASL
jgi:flagellar export protein FliJ